MIEDNGRAVIWHSLFGKPKIVSKDTLKFLNIFTMPRSLNSMFSEYEFEDDNKLSIEELIKDYYLVPKGFNERIFLVEKMKTHEKSITDSSLIDYLELIVSEECNFRCKYCIHFNNLKTSDRLKNQKKFMSFEVAKEAIDYFLVILRQHKKTIAEVNFGGGEPLLNWPVIKKILEYCISTYTQEFTFRFSINTNLSLITDEITRKLKEYHIEIASSLDGLRKGNDQVRLTKSGNETFDIIMKGIKTLTDQNYPLDGIAITLNEYNFPYLDEKIIDWAAEWHMHEVRIDIDVIGMIEIPIKDIIEKLMRIRQYAKEHGIDVAGFWSRPAENLNDSTLETHIAFCGATRGNSICVSPSGNIYACGYSTTQLGILAQMDSFYIPEGKYHRFVRNHLTGMIKMCKGCIIEGQCNGGCNITQEFVHATKNPNTMEYLCNFYRQMTQLLLLEQLKETNY